MEGGWTSLDGRMLWQMVGSKAAVAAATGFVLNRKTLLKWDIEDDVHVRSTSTKQLHVV